MVFYFFMFFVFSGVIRGLAPLIVLFRHSRNLLSGIHVFAFSFDFQLLLDPGLKIAGVTNKGNRTIQEQAKSGLKIAGVTMRCHCEFVVSLTWQSRVFSPM